MSMVERWAFTAAELRRPRRCSGDDLFLAYSAFHEEGVWVSRRGDPTSHFDEVEDFDDLYLVDEDDSANITAVVGYRDVFVREDGAFDGFADAGDDDA